MKDTGILPPPPEEVFGAEVNIQMPEDALQKLEKDLESFGENPNQESYQSDLPLVESEDLEKQEMDKLQMEFSNTKVLEND